ncbi:hypothetical protein RvY_12241 [Ramazzottius varieornatus]|uniref:HAT C-terminal dimerisation domain-containing protein n=1 Tax=Ramazzottius varieornatus TaxID=947166 RepID=A0A1D1VIT2_RAMVA|nr:hypothetical protein RvY_12241 [Ramazzottius varieornatus]
MSLSRLKRMRGEEVPCGKSSHSGYGRGAGLHCLIKTGTASLLHHSAKCKEKAAGSIQQYLKVGVTTEEKQLMSEALAKFCALDSRAFRVCEGKGFELMIVTVLGIARKHKGAPFPARELLPSAATVGTSVTNQAKALRKISVPKLKKILTTRGVCISLDGWTEDYTKTKFVGFIIHYTEDCILKEELITIPEFDATKIETRWNSNLDMLYSIIWLYSELDDILQERDERNRPPAPVDFLRAVAELLQPFKTATLALESSSIPTIHLVVPYFIKIRAHVSQPISEEFQDLPQYSAPVAYQKRLKKVRDAKLVVDELHKGAVFLNPAMKGLLMYPTAEQSAIINGVQKIAVNHADEISLYQSLPPPVSSKPILEFWQEHAATLPKLYKLAVRVLAVPVSSCSPERLFSDAGNIFTEKRTSLDGEKLDDLLYLKWNLVVEDSGKPKTSAKNSLKIV